MNVFIITLVIFWFWTVTADDRNLEHLDNFVTQSKRLIKKKYRPIYHITAPEGWISSPTGFTVYKKQYHIFFQYHSYNGAWGRMSWGHAVSENLIDWIHLPTALMPKDYYDRHGCLAGSAVVNKNILTLFYTGYVVKNNDSYQTQNIAISGDGMFFRKYLYNPIIREAPNGIAEIRHPKVWRFRNVWYMFIGTTSRQRNAQLILYTSEDMLNWKLSSTINSYGDMGYMWEHPDFFKLDGYHVLILSVQGIEADGWRFRNLYQTGYILGHFDYIHKLFDDMEISTSTFNQLDYGHDFYAAKTTRTVDGRRVLMGWLGMWKSDFVESSLGWASMLTMVRELRLNGNGRLLMMPLREATELRIETTEDAWYKPGEHFRAESKSFELLINSTSISKDVAIVFEWKFGSFIIGYSAEHEYVSIDRGGIDGVRRAYWSPTHHIYLRIFVDSSSVEVFCGDGEVVFSSRIYPKSMRIRVAGNSELYITQYRLRRSLGLDTNLFERMKNHVINN